MSGFSTPNGGAPSAQQPKQISSRLLNMKFMQRAAAVTSHKSGSSPTTPSGERQPKRRRTGDFSTTADGLKSPSTPSYSDRTAISGALTAEADSTSIRRGTNNFDISGQETRWVLDVRSPTTTNGNTNGANVANGTYESGEEESDEETEDEVWSSSSLRGRQTYGAFDKKKQQRKATNTNTGLTTPSSEKSSRKRDRPDDFDDGDLSSIPSENSNDDSEGEVVEEMSQTKRKKGTFDFQSEAGLRRVDAFDLQKMGAASGLGRQRLGLSGGGGGGRVGNGMGASSAPAHGQQERRKKVRKTM